MTRRRAATDVLAASLGGPPRLADAALNLHRAVLGKSLHAVEHCRLRRSLETRRARADEDNGTAKLFQRLLVGGVAEGYSPDLLGLREGRGVVGGLRVIAAITLGTSRLLLRNVDAKGYLDIELVYRLRQKESLGSVKQKIVRKIQQNESVLCSEDSVTEFLVLA